MNTSQTVPRAMHAPITGPALTPPCALAPPGKTTTISIKASGAASLMRCATFLAGTSLSLAAVAQQLDSPVGIWQLLSLTTTNIETNQVSRPWGENPSGQLWYSASGRMHATLTADHQMRKVPVPDSADASKDREQLYMNSSAYYGTWKANGDTLTHKVEAATNPAWVGSEQIRYLRMEEGNLVIDTAPLLAPDGKSKVKVRLVWWRVE